MQVRQVTWILWLAGTALIVGSWVNVVPPEVGWLGFAVAGGAYLISLVAPGQVDRSRLPLTQEGLPVEPSGTPIPQDMMLVPGSPVLVNSQGRWWRATVIRVEENGEVVLRFPGWDEKRVARVPRKQLQVDPDPNRQPLILPPGPMERWTGGRPPDGFKTPDSTTGVQE